MKNKIMKYSADDIFIFITVAETLNLSQASKELGLSTSSISRRLTQLECDLEIQLLHRDTRKIILTKEGENLYSTTNHIKKALQQSIDNIKAQYCKVKISVPTYFGKHYIQPMINLFQKDYPNIPIELLLSDNLVDLMQHNYDMAFRSSEIQDSRYIVHRFGFRKMVLCAAPEYLSKAGSIQVPQDLKNCNCLNHVIISSDELWSFKQEADDQVHIQISGDYASNSSELLLAAALDGRGIVYLPSYVVSESIYSGKLVSILDQYTYDAYNFFLIYPQSQFRSNSAELLIKYFKEKLPNIPGI